MSRRIKRLKGLFVSEATQCSQGDKVVVCDNFGACLAGQNFKTEETTHFIIGQVVRYIGVQKNPNYSDGTVMLLRFEYLGLEYLGPINCFTTESHWMRITDSICGEMKRLSQMGNVADASLGVLVTSKTRR